MHILVVNDDGPPSPLSSPYVHSFVRALQAAGHVVSVCLPHTQRSWIGKAHLIGQTVKPRYYRPPPPSRSAAGLPSPSSSENSNSNSKEQGQQELPADQEDPHRHGTTHSRPGSEDDDEEEWILVDGTPASCVQIGLHHFFAERGAVDLVVSGPNYGRNTTAVFALSSGTLGGALEAAACRLRAVALSFAFFSRGRHDPAVIAAASRLGVRVIEALAARWPADGSVDLYSVNVPLVEGVEDRKVLFAGILQNYWSEGSCFTEVEGSVDGEVEEEERIRAEGEAGEEKAAGREHKHFKWTPRTVDVHRSVAESPPGNDGWVVKEGHTSITPLKANFWHASTHLHGTEFQLPPIQTPTSAAATVAAEETIPNPESGVALPLRDGIATATAVRMIQPDAHFYALIAYEDDYVQPLILSAMHALFPARSWTLLTAPPASEASESEPEISLQGILPATADPAAKLVQITPYERIDFAHAAAHPRTCLINSYMIRKALIRKHFLSATVDGWAAKHPGSALGAHVKRTEAFELDYAEFLDDALVEAFDLRASLERNAALVDSEERGEDGGEDRGGVKEWWILKPGMSDRGQGIRLFSTMEELQAIFDGWEAERPDSEDGEEEEEEEREEEDRAGDTATPAADYITTSHLRHFVAQPYIDPPLLLPQLGNRKFHIRVYVLAVGCMRVYVYRDMLALFAAKPYQSPNATESTTTEPIDLDLDAHLTNTCLQGPGASDSDSVHRFWSLAERGWLAPKTATSIFDQVCAVTGEAFEAAARGQVVHFQPLGCAFEVFGLDFLVDAAADAWLLEVNAFPDFRQTGAALHGVVRGFWTAALRRAVGGFVSGDNIHGKQESVGGDGDGDGDGDGMVLVRDVDLGRRGGPPFSS